MGQSAKRKRRRRAAVILPASIALVAGGAIGGGFWWYGGTLRQVDDTARFDTIPSQSLSFGGHLAEPFIPCSSNIIDCFSKADFAAHTGARLGTGLSAGRSTRQSRGPRSRFIPGRDETPQPGFPVGIDPLDATVSTPLTFLAEEIAPFTGGGSGSAAQSQRFNLSPQNAGVGGIGGEAIAFPVPTPTPTPAPTPTTTPPVIETPVPAVPEPAIWLQMLVGFAIVGTMLRGRRGRRGAKQFS